MESNLILYTSDNGDVSIQVCYEDGTFWLTQKRMAELFNVSVSTINEHLKSILNTGELSEDATIRNIPNSSKRRHSPSNTRGGILSFGRHYRSGVSGQLRASHLF